MAILKRQTAGQAFDPSAGTWNRFVDVALEAERNADKPDSAGKSEPKSQTLVWVKNSSSNCHGRYCAMKIDTPTITPTDNEGEFLGRIAFGAVDLTGEGPEKFLVLQEPLADGQIGKAAIAGVTQARIFISSATDQYCHPIARKIGGYYFEVVGLTTPPQPGAIYSLEGHQVTVIGVDMASGRGNDLHLRVRRDWRYRDFDEGIRHRRCIDRLPIARL